MKKFNVIVIGLGRIGMKYGLEPSRIQPASHVAAILGNKNLQLVAVCDTNKSCRKLFVKNYGVTTKVFEDYEKLVDNINDKKIEFDILVIATPDSTHSTILKYIIKKLKPPKKQAIIFCEKPLALDSKSVEDLSMLNSRLNIVVNHSRRWSKIWQEAHKLTDKIGEIQKATFYFSTSPENREILQIRDGIHIADLLSWFNIAQKTVVTRLSLPYFVYDFHLWGSKGKIEVLNTDQVLNFFKVEKSRRFQGFKELQLKSSKKFTCSPLSTAYEEFVEFLRDKKTILSTNFDDAISALKIFEKYVINK